MDAHVGTAMDRCFADQHGVASRRPLVAVGVTPRQWRRRISSRAWVPVAGGVVRLRSAPRTWHQSVMGACLAAGPDAVASHRSAAVLWALGDSRPGAVEVTVPRWRRRTPAVVVHETLDLSYEDRGLRDGIPVTSAVRTLIDLAALLPPERLEEAFDDAERRGLVTTEAVELRFRELARRGRPGVARLRSLLAARTGRVPESRLERRAQRLLIESGLPEPVLQHEVVRRDGRSARIDLTYPSARLAIELDGRAFHGPTRFQHDRTRQNELSLTGWTVLRFTWQDLAERPEHVVMVVRTALEAAA